jgi:hypothetical protein
LPAYPIVTTTSLGTALEVPENVAWVHAGTISQPR